MEYKEMRMIDIAKAEIVQVVANATEVWVNVDGICLFRAKQCARVEVEANERIVVFK